MALQLGDFQLFKERDDAKVVERGVIKAEKKTQDWSCAGCGFVALDNFESNAYLDNNDASMTADWVGETVNFLASVNLPDGATLTEGVVYGSDSNDSWNMIRVKISNKSTNTMIQTANVNTITKNVSKEFIDNSKYAYFIEASGERGDEIYGARIRYVIQ